MRGGARGCPPSANELQRRDLCTSPRSRTCGRTRSPCRAVPYRPQSPQRSRSTARRAPTQGTPPPRRPCLSDSLSSSSFVFYSFLSFRRLHPNPPRYRCYSSPSLWFQTFPQNPSNSSLFSSPCRGSICTGCLEYTDPFGSFGRLPRRRRRRFSSRVVVVVVLLFLCFLLLLLFLSGLLGCCLGTRLVCRRLNLPPFFGPCVCWRSRESK